MKLEKLIAFDDLSIQLSRTDKRILCWKINFANISLLALYDDVTDHAILQPKWFVRVTDQYLITRQRQKLRNFVKHVLDRSSLQKNLENWDKTLNNSLDTEHSIFTE